MRLSEARQKALRNTVVGNAAYATEFMEMMPLFKEVSLEMVLMSRQIYRVLMCQDPSFNTCEDVKKARDTVANKMIALMEKWKAA